MEGSLGASPPLTSVFVRSQVCLCSVAGKNTQETLVRRPALSRSVSNAFNYCDGLSQPLSVGPESPRANIPMFSVRVWSPLFNFVSASPPSFLPAQELPPRSYNSMFSTIEIDIVPFTSSPLHSRPKEDSPLLNPKTCFVLEGSRKVVHSWVPIWVFPCCRILGWPVWLLFALLPPAIACQILGTFEKFSDFSSARSAGFSHSRRQGCPWAGREPPCLDFRPFALSFGLKPLMIGLRVRFLV